MEHEVRTCQVEARAARFEREQEYAAGACVKRVTKLDALARWCVAVKIQAADALLL